jgi:hypothetical protein
MVQLVLVGWWPLLGVLGLGATKNLLAISAQEVAGERDVALAVR